MTLEQFARKAGLSIVRCDPHWGGTFGYKHKDHPNSTFCGYRTESAAYKGWLKNTFGNNTSKALLALLDK